MPARQLSAPHLVASVEGGPMMCDRCGQPIRRGQKSLTVPKDSASGAGGVATLHKELCRKPPTQTYPARSSR
ncbi:hypothetical protein [Streptomyces turgidiscabies]|uniref:hypothetical protein n=1 Tax=Streptomyces turgidiscabies TaxID=85558 RepID=UPI0038F61554